MIVKLILYIFILFVVFFIVNLVWGAFFDNKYTFDLYMGKPGAGKSLYSMKLIEDHLKDKKMKWHVYSDDPSCKIPGVQYFNSIDLKNGDWFPPYKNTLLVWDEAGTVFNNRDSAKNFRPETLYWWKMHRHYKCKIIMISQSADIDKKLRDMADHYYIVRRSIFKLFISVIPVRKEIDVIGNAIDKDGKMNAGGSLQDVYKKGGLLTRKYAFIPFYVNKYDSFRK